MCTSTACDCGVTIKLHKTIGANDIVHGRELVFTDKERIFDIIGKYQFGGKTALCYLYLFLVYIGATILKMINFFVSC